MELIKKFTKINTREVSAPNTVGLTSDYETNLFQVQDALRVQPILQLDDFGDFFNSPPTQPNEVINAMANVNLMDSPDQYTGNLQLDILFEPPSHSTAASNALELSSLLQDFSLQPNYTNMSGNISNIYQLRHQAVEGQIYGNGNDVSETLTAFSNSNPFIFDAQPESTPEHIQNHPNPSDYFSIEPISGGNTLYSPHNPFTLPPKTEIANSTSNSILLNDKPKSLANRTEVILDPFAKKAGESTASSPTRVEPPAHQRLYSLPPSNNTVEFDRNLKPDVQKTTADQYLNSNPLSSNILNQKLLVLDQIDGKGLQIAANCYNLLI
jgi:hypothetical protein